MSEYKYESICCSDAVAVKWLNEGEWGMEWSRVQG